MRTATVTFSFATLLLGAATATPAPKGGAPHAVGTDPAPKGEDSLPDAPNSGSATAPSTTGNGGNKGIGLMETSMAVSCGLDVCDEPDCLFTVSNINGCSGHSDPFPGACASPYGRPITKSICKSATITLDPKGVITLKNGAGQVQNCTFQGPISDASICQLD